MIAGSLSLYFCSSGLAQTTTGSIQDSPPSDNYSTTSIIGGSSKIRAVDMNEVRTFINAKRVAAGLGAYAFTDPVLTAGVSRVRAIHFAELQVALKEIYDKPSGAPPVIWQQYFRTNYRTSLDAITPSGGNISSSSLKSIINSPIRATTMSSLRNAIAAAGFCGDTICQNYSGTGPENCSNCPGDCLLACSTVTNPVCGAPCGSGNCNSSSKCQTQTCPVTAGPTCTVTNTCVPNIACTCGNTSCEPLTGETAANCNQDCAGCGNGIINSPEQCDGANLNGQTCVTRGFIAGTLNCSPTCTFDTSACTNGVSDPCNPKDCSSCPTSGQAVQSSPGCCVEQCLPQCTAWGPGFLNQSYCGGDGCGTNQRLAYNVGISPSPCWNKRMVDENPSLSCYDAPADCNCGNGLCTPWERYYCADCLVCQNPPSGAKLCPASPKDYFVTSWLAGKCSDGCPAGACAYCCPSGTSMSSDFQSCI